MAGIGGFGRRSRNGFGGIVLDGFRGDGGGKGGSRELFTESTRSLVEKGSNFKIEMLTDG